MEINRLSRNLCDFKVTGHEYVLMDLFSQAFLAIWLKVEHEGIGEAAKCQPQQRTHRRCTVTSHLWRLIENN